MSAEVPVPKEVPLTPIDQFSNSKLRDSIAAALEDVPVGHGNALLTIDNKGAGVMVVHRINETWAVVAAGRYTFGEGGEVQAALRGSW